MSRENRFCGSIDPELTEDGRAMAEQFAAANSATAWTAVYCSPMKRAVATALPACALHGLKPVERDGLREIAYGKWEGCKVEEVDRDYHDDHVRWLADPGWNSPTGGETAITIATRALAVVEEIKRDHPNGDVLIVSHKATIRIILCSLLGIDTGRFRFRLACPVASANVVEFGSRGPLLLRLADRSHLDDRLRDLPGT